MILMSLSPFLNSQTLCKREVRVKRTETLRMNLPLSLDLVNQLPHRLLEFLRSDCYCEETLTSKLVNLANLANHDGVGAGPQNDPRIAEKMVGVNVLRKIAAKCGMPGLLRR